MKKILSLLLILLFAQCVLALRGDINQDGIVDGYDLIILARSFGLMSGQKGYNMIADLASSGKVDGEDLSILASNFGRHSAGAASRTDFPFVPGQVVVRFCANIESTRKLELLNGFSSQILKEYRDIGVSIVSVPAEMSEDDMIGFLSAFSEVEYAELNYIYKALWRPNDVLYLYQWHFDSINLEEAWDISKGGSSSIIIGVVDSGAAYEDYGPYRAAPDLEGTVFVSPYNFVEETTHANDQTGHGTHVTGTIAQTTNNTYGTAGIAFNCRIMPLKVLDETGSGTTVNIARAIDYAKQHGAKVINMSLGGGGFSSTLNNAVQSAYSSGVVLVAATGNEADEPDYTPGILYPAGYDNVIAVGAVRFDNSRSYYSNYGEGIDLMAPGGDLTIDQNGDGYGDGILQETLAGSYSDFGFYFYQGTSMAAPHVSGLVAMIMSVGVREPVSIYDLLTQTALDLGNTGYDTEYGYGLIDAFAAMNRATGGMGWAN